MSTTTKRERPSRAALPMVEAVAACCEPLLTNSLDEDGAEQLAAAFRVLGDATRLRLISLIAERGETCVCDLTEPLGLSQPTVSHHLKLLHDAGLVERQPRGTWVYYRLVPGSLDVLRDVLVSPPRARRK